MLENETALILQSITSQDLIRLNRSIEFNDEFISPAVVITHRTKTIDRTFHKTILPISQAELDANPAIRSQQNPGY